GCTSAGSEKRVCANNAEHTETRAVNATGHSYTDEVTDPTCTEDGYTTYTCSNCGDSYTGNEVDATGHTYGAPVWRWNGYVSATATFTCGTCNHEEVKNASISRVTANASCTVAGDTTYTAKVTFEGNEYTDEKVSRGEKQPHTPKLVDVIQEATCTEMGSGLYECEVCHEQYNDAIEALGHDIQQHEAQALNCTEAGWNAYEACTRCDYTTKTEIAALGHEWSTEWSNDGTNHWHECTVCHEKKDEAAHTYDWVITKDPTEDEEGEKEEYCTVCQYASGNKETIAKLVKDPEGNGDVIDLPVLPPNQDYDLEIAVKESDSLYNIAGITKGYKVELFVVDGENRTEYDNSKKVTLMLVIPEGMEDAFTLYCRHGDILEPVDPATYTVSGKSVTIRTTLPNEYVFNAPAPEPEEPSSGIPWWVWLLVGLGGATLLAIVIVIIVVAKKKNKDDGTSVDNGEVLSQLAEQGQKIDELLTRSDDGGFNTPVELDENGNVIFK
ncbi:MAG: hypothetical protein K2K80_07865, partial [Clostridia bacterium]|nr:hypothetical protein [Clostridia bacterium]